MSALIILLFLAIPAPIYNTTSLLIPTALFLCLFFIFAHNSATPIAGGAILAGICVAGICSLKTNLAPACVFFAGAHALFGLMRSARPVRMALQGFLSFMVAGALILPWLLDAYHWTGKLLPFSLEDYYASPALLRPFATIGGWRNLPAHISDLPVARYVGLGILSLLVLRRLPGPERDVFLSMLVGAAGGSVAVLVAMGGFNDLPRYVFPFLISTVLVAFVELAAVYGPKLARREKPVLLITAAVLFALMIPGSRTAASMYRGCVQATARALRHERLVSPAVMLRHRHVQEAVPPGAAILTSLKRPFLLDFRRNPVLIIDFPGGASLAPGLPFFQGSEAIAWYLTAHDIRYVMYDYATEVGTPRRGMLAALALDSRYPFAQTIVQHLFDLHYNFRELGRTRQRLYDNGTAFVIDLLKQPTVPATF